MGWYLGSVTVDGFKSNSGLANGLDDFYLRFNDERDFTENHCDLFDSLGDIIANLQPTISAISVRSTLLKCIVRKAGVLT